MCSNLHHRGQFEFVHVLKCNIGEKSGLFYEDCAVFVEKFEIMEFDLISLTPFFTAFIFTLPMYLPVCI